MGKEAPDFIPDEEARTPADAAPDFIPDDHPSEPTQDSPGVGSQVAEGVGRALDYGGGLSRVALSQSAPAQMADALQAYLRKKPMVSGGMSDWGRALKGDAPRSAEFMDRAGIPEGGSLSDLIPGAYTSSPEEAEKFWRLKLAKGGLFDPTARGTAGFALDTITDPLTGLSGLKKLAEGGGALSKISNGLRRLANPLQTSEDALRSGAIKATEAHLRPTPGIKRIKGPENMADIAAETLDSGSMKAGTKASGTSERLSNLKEESGKVMGDYIDEAKGQIHPQEIADKFDAQVIEPLRGTDANKPLVESLEKTKQGFLDQYAGTADIYEQMNPDLKAIFDKLPEQSKTQVLETMAKQKTMGAAQTEAEKRAVTNNIDYDALGRRTPKGNAQKGWANVLADTGENLIDEPGFTAAKRTFGNASSAKKMADRTSSLTHGMGLMGHLTDLAVAGEAARELYNGDTKGLGLLAARALTRGRMASTAGVGLNNLSKLAGSKYAPAIDAVIRRKEINALSPASNNPWQNALQSQTNGGNQ